MRRYGRHWEDSLMRIVCMCALLLVSCGSSEPCGAGAGGAGGTSDGSGGCVIDIGCRAYCGSLDLTDRCITAFGPSYSDVRECDAPNALDCCQSLSDFSPGLTSDCDDAGRFVLCCIHDSGSAGSGGASGGAGGTGGECAPVVAPECDCCHLPDGSPCCNGQTCFMGVCQ